MPKEDFQRLVDAMPRIAEAVKDLPNELQERAFEELISAFKGVPTPPPDPTDVSTASQQAATGEILTGAEEDSSVAPLVVEGTSRQAKKAAAPRKASTRRTWTPDRHIDFWPDGKQSFKDFVDEKKPSNLHQKNLISVFWLDQVVELAEVGVGQVLAAFKAVDWNEPPDLQAALRRTASAEHWIDTRSTKAIKTTPGGRNMVKRMPVESGSK